MTLLKQLKRYFHSIKIICCLCTISLIIVVVFWNVKSKNTSSLRSVFNLSKSHFTNSSFRNELINERLASYSRMYDTSSYGCNTNEPLSAVQRSAFSTISQSLMTLRQQIISYPNEYFHGQGIVLTIGPDQWDFAKINLEMIQITGTRLPVQVNMFISR